MQKRIFPAGGLICGIELFIHFKICVRHIGAAVMRKIDIFQLFFRADNKLSACLVKLLGGNLFFIQLHFFIYRRAVISRAVTENKNGIYKRGAGNKTHGKAYRLSRRFSRGAHDEKYNQCHEERRSYDEKFREGKRDDARRHGEHRTDGNARGIVYEIGKRHALFCDKFNGKSHCTERKKYKRPYRNIAEKSASRFLFHSEKHRPFLCILS